MLRRSTWSSSMYGLSDGDLLTPPHSAQHQCNHSMNRRACAKRHFVLRPRRPKRPLVHVGARGGGSVCYHPIGLGIIWPGGQGICGPVYSSTLSEPTTHNRHSAHRGLTTTEAIVLPRDLHGYMHRIAPRQRMYGDCTRALR